MDAKGTGIGGHDESTRWKGTLWDFRVWVVPLLLSDKYSSGGRCLGLLLQHKREAPDQASGYGREPSLILSVSSLPPEPGFSSQCATVCISHTLAHVCYGDISHCDSLSSL